MSGRINFKSGAVWEDVVGYSRAVKINNVIEVSGTVAADQEGHVLGRNDAYQQTLAILQKIETALTEAGASLKDVVRTRMFVTDITRFEEYGRAHGEVFGTIRPCTSMIEVRSLVSPEFLIEIEATAVIAESGSIK